MAVRCRGRSIAYSDVDSAANALARTFVEQGVRKGDRVGIYLPKSVEVLPAVYGAMRAGAAYVPIDPRGPAQRAALVAADCSISALVTTPELASSLAMEREEVRPKIAVLVAGGADLPALPFPVARYEVVTAEADISDPDVPMTDIDLAHLVHIRFNRRAEGCDALTP